MRSSKVPLPEGTRKLGAEPGDYAPAHIAMNLPITERPEDSFTLPSRAYTDPIIFEMEKEKIFYRSWQYVAHESHVRKPGDYVTLRICDQNVFVIRGADNTLRAFYNVCQHRAHELLQGGRSNTGRVIVCPYHAWTYELDGRLRGAPRSDMRPAFCPGVFSLVPIRLELFLNCVFVNLDPDAVPLAEQAGDLEDDIRARIPFLDELSTPVDYWNGETRIKAGWKVVVDNFVECYHCDHAHPDFSSLICMDSYQHDTFGLWSRQLGGDLREENTAYPLRKNSDFMLSAFWYLWPNTTFNVLPGRRELNIFAIRPTDIETTDFDGHSLAMDDSYDPLRAAYVAERLVPEDIALCESVQRGLKSRGYSQGPIIAGPDRSGRGEHALHHFHRLVKAALEAET